MRFLILFFFSLILGVTTAFGQVNSNKTYVKGYQKSNGTYVQGHYRTKPNNTINDNYSTYPNYNPHTGKQGTVRPTYSTPRPTYSTPRPTYSAPRPTYSAPKRTYSAPKRTYSAPKRTYTNYNYGR